MSESTSAQHVYMLQAADNNQARLIPIEWRQFGALCSSCSHTVDPRDCPFTHLTPSSTTSVPTNGNTAYEPIALQDIHFARDSGDPSKYIVINLIAHDATPIALGDLRIARDPRDPQRWIVINMVAATAATAESLSAPAATDAAWWNDVWTSTNNEVLANSEAEIRLAAFRSFMHQQRLNSKYYAAAEANDTVTHKDDDDGEATRKEIKKEVKEEIAE